MHNHWDLALECWQNQDFWHVHEHFEELWKSTSGVESMSYQALLISGVFFHHSLNGNAAGALLCAKRALPLLEKCAKTFRGINMREFSAKFESAVEHVRSGRTDALIIPPLSQHIELD